MPETLKVVIADDDPGMRLIVRKMVERVDGFTLVGEAANGDELMTLVEEKRPQVCFLDVEMTSTWAMPSRCTRSITLLNPSRWSG